MPTFGNPAGFLALVAIPAILAIHFLQRESRRVVSSTLFLLEQLAPESAQGRRFERLRSSAALWLQLAAALLATWLLADPRWIRPDAAQHVMLVLDSTVSMSAFRDGMLRAVDADTARLASAAAHTEWQVLETDMTRPTVYSGPDRAALMDALRAWEPHLGAHDPGPQIQAAQSILGGNGTLIFVTDRKRQLPAGVRLLAVGHPFDHCGFCGVTVEGTAWRALARNYGSTAQQRRWWVEAGGANGQKSPPQELALPPGGAVELSGAFPPGMSRCELVMDADAFPLDSRLPMLIPQLKRLSIRTAPAADYHDFFKQFLGSLDRADIAAPPDLTLSVYDPLAPALPAGPSIVFVSDPTPSATYAPGNVTASANSIASELNWSGLLAHESLGVPLIQSDETLVWQGDRPLIFLRGEGGPLLVVDFDIRASNAPELPAFILLLHRFAEQIRASKMADESRNLETNEAITVASDPRLPPPVIAGMNEPAFRAPAEPGFFKVTQQGRELLDGAAHFADARAADFRDAASADDVAEETARTIRRNSQPDPLAPLWMLMLGLAMTGSWGWRRG
jgi:hypothetical protein